MASESNHGGVRPGAGRPAINRVNISLDLGKSITSNLDEMSVIDMADRARTSKEAIRILSQCSNMLKSIAPNEAASLQDMIVSFRAESELLKTEIDARKKASRHYMLAAITRELIEIPRLVRGAKSRITSGDEDVIAKRKKLLDAGIDESEATRVVPDYDSVKDETIIAELEAELAQWVKFMQFQQLKWLPANADECVSKIGVFR